jgi:hypothetical protein
VWASVRHMDMLLNDRDPMFMWLPRRTWRTHRAMLARLWSIGSMLGEAGNTRDRMATDMTDSATVTTIGGVKNSTIGFWSHSVEWTGGLHFFLSCSSTST